MIQGSVIIGLALAGMLGAVVTAQRPRATAEFEDAAWVPLRGEIRLELGDARGRWDGRTLVVEIRRFKQRSAYRNADAETLRLIERFTRTAPDRVEWTVTVDDPQTWIRPWTFSMPLTMNDEEEVAQYECHEGNHAIRNILSAERAKERGRQR